MGGEGYRAVVVGGSAGGLEALDALLRGLPPDFPLPLLVVQHLHAGDGGAFAEHLARAGPLRVVEARDKEAVVPGRVYTAPAGYHLLVERSGALALSVDERVNWARPSIDVLFESAARAFGAALAAVVLSGANEDGAAGLRAVHRFGGLTCIQDPATAKHPFMPRAALATGVVDEVGSPGEIAALLARLPAPAQSGGVPPAPEEDP